MPHPEWSFFMLPEDHKEVKWLQSFAQAKFTIWGQIVFGLILVGMAISAAGTQISAYFYISLVWALFLTCLFLSSFFKPEMTAVRLLPPTPTAGGICLYRVIVTNTGKRVIRNLEIFDHKLPYGLYSIPDHPEQKTSIDWFEPGKQVIFTIALRIPQRGSYVIEPLIAGTSFPTGFLRSICKVGARDPFVVYPKIIKLPDLTMRLEHQYQSGGSNVSARIGSSNDFLSTRDYREGDRPRDIHWNSSARTGKLIVKEYSEEYFVRVGLFVDTELKRFEKHRCYESRISLCAGVAEDFYKNNYIVDLFLSETNAPMTEVGQGRDHFSHLLEMLSAIEGGSNPDFIAPLGKIKEHAPHISSMILFLKDWDEQRSEFVSAIKALGIATKVLIVRDQPLTIPNPDVDVQVYNSKQIEGKS